MVIFATHDPSIVLQTEKRLIMKNGAIKKIIEHEVDSIPVVEVNKDNINNIKVIGKLSKTNITKLLLEIVYN